MKRTILVWAAIFALTTLGMESIANPAVAQKVRVAVRGFQNISSWHYWGANLGHAATDELITQLVRTGLFSVVEREQLDAILSEQNLGQSGRVNASTAAAIGEVLGVQVVLMGSITQFSIDTKKAGIGGFGASFSEAESILHVRVVNTSTAEIMLVAQGDGAKRFGGAAVNNIRFEQQFDAGIAQEALRPAVGKAVEEIIDRASDLASLQPVATTANVVGTSERSVYVDRGENFGIQLGQRFVVYRVVDEIKDAQGQVLDRITEQVGLIEVTRVLSQSAICVVVDGEAAEGDTAKAEGS